VIKHQPTNSTESIAPSWLLLSTGPLVVLTNEAPIREGDPCCCDKGGLLLESGSFSQILGDEGTLFQSNSATILYNIGIIHLVTASDGITTAKLLEQGSILATNSKGGK
jgi:hypothetical protein